MNSEQLPRIDGFPDPNDPFRVGNKTGEPMRRILAAHPEWNNTKADQHRRICQQLNDIYRAKNEAYGDSFGETYRKLGILSAITRMTDKMNRLTALCTGARNDVTDESIEDTLLDLANYAIMTRIEMDQAKLRQKEFEPTSPYAPISKGSVSSEDLPEFEVDPIRVTLFRLAPDTIKRKVFCNRRVDVKEALIFKLKGFSGEFYVGDSSDAESTTFIEV